MTLLDPVRHHRGGHRIVTMNVWPDGAWSRHIRKVQGWLRDPPILDDDETPPAAPAIDLCIQTFAALQARMPAPTRVMPDGEGGLIAEWIGTRTRVVEINEDLSVDFTVLEQGMRFLRETYRHASVRESNASDPSADIPARDLGQSPREVSR